jgi:hypothetical protein
LAKAFGTARPVDELTDATDGFFSNRNSKKKHEPREVKNNDPHGPLPHTSPGRLSKSLGGKALQQSKT